jgi:hypothetical protein
MNVLAIPHEPDPLVVFEVFLPYGAAFSEQSSAAWRDAAWATFATATSANLPLRRAIEDLLTVHPYVDLVRTRDLTGHPDFADPKLDAKVAGSASASLLERTDARPCVAVFSRNLDELDPSPLLLAWTTAVGIAIHEGGVVYAPRFGRLWEPRAEPEPRLAGTLAVRDFLSFDAGANEAGSFAATTGLPAFGLPDVSWHAPRATDADAMRNVLVGVASALLRARRSAGRRTPGLAALEVPAMLPVLYGDVAAAYGLDVQHMRPPPDTQLAAVPMDVSTDLRLAIRTHASAAALNDWLGGLRDRASRMSFDDPSHLPSTP